MAWRDREGWLKFVFLGDGKGDGTNHHQKQGLKRISCASQFTIHDMAGTCHDLACNNTDTRSSQPNQASRIPNSSFCSYPPHRSHLYPSSLSFSSTTLPSSQNTKLSHLSLSLHAMIMSWDRVQAYTEYSIHRVQHTPKIVCLPFILMITSWPLNVACASGVPPYMIDPHQPALHESS